MLAILFMFLVVILGRGLEHCLLFAYNHKQQHTGKVERLYYKGLHISSRLKYRSVININFRNRTTNTRPQFKYRFSARSRLP